MIKKGGGMKYVKNCAFLLLALSATAAAQTPLQGPRWVHPHPQAIDVQGEVLVSQGAPYKGRPCAQIRVLPDLRYSGGRVWVCDAAVQQLSIHDRVRLKGVPSDTRLTRMGPHRRVIPVVIAPVVIKKIKP